MSTHHLQADIKPFRWNLASESELGTLISEDYELEPEFSNQVRNCAVKVVVNLNHSYLVFVGRSLESINSYLAGIVKNTVWDGSMANLNISLYDYSMSYIRGEGEFYIDALKNHLCLLELHPDAILHRPAPTTFVDVVHRGSTFSRLFEFLKQWTIDEKLDFPAVKRKLRFLGVTSGAKSSPNIWRWEQHAKWVKEIPKNVRNVTIDRWFWRLIANDQDKMTTSVTFDKWLSEDITSPVHKEEHIKALNQAHSLYCLGLDKHERKLFAKTLAKLNLKDRFHRKLILDIKGL